VYPYKPVHAWGTASQNYSGRPNFEELCFDEGYQHPKAEVLMPMRIFGTATEPTRI
jgi:hypothetical protein